MDNPSKFFAIYDAYKKTHQKDSVNFAEFAEAVNDIYPSEGDEAMKLRLRSSHPTPHVQSSLPQPKETPTADTPGPVATPAPRSSEQSVKETPLLSSQSRRSLPWATDTKTPTNASPQVNGTKAMPTSSAPPGLASARATQRTATGSMAPTLNRNGLTTQSHRPLAQSMNTTLKAPNAVQTRAITTSVAPQSKPDVKSPIDDMDLDERRANDQGISVFAEFARAYEALEPGGAFAEPMPSNRRRRREKGKAPRLDVLSWQL